MGNGYYLFDDKAVLSYSVKALQELNLKLEDLATTTAESAWQPDSFVSCFFTALKGRLIAWFADTANGITRFFARKVQTDELCVGSTCITESQLAALLSQSAAAGLANPTPTIDPTSSQPPLADTTTSTSSEQAALPQAEAVPAPPLAPELLQTAPDSSPIVPDQLAGQSDPSTSESIPVSQ